MDNRDAIAAWLPTLGALYEEFHRMPELSMREHKTADRIAAELKKMGIGSFRCGGTGVIAVMENGSGPVVAYRADIDGLPITEETGLSYASATVGELPDGSETGVMHACGHDTHVTIGLGIARMLLEHKDLWAGTVVFLFQPGEETGEGALAMLDDGLWDKVPKPEAIYGQHDYEGRAGTVKVATGATNAIADSLAVTVKGRQAHSSTPQDAIDPVILGAFMITRLQTIVSREISSKDVAVVTAAVFQGGTKENIIPDSARFELDIRTFDPDVRDTVLGAVRRIVTSEAQGSGAPEPDITQFAHFPRCVNDEALATALIGEFCNEFGDDNVSIATPEAGGEDFGRFGDSIGVPYVYWSFGVYSDGKLVGETPPPGPHSQFFAPDAVPEFLQTGVRAGMIALLRHVGNCTNAETN
jgi:hippurate hydrolase